MKINKKVIIAGAALLTFAACKTEMKQPTEAEIDALVNEKVEAVKKQLQDDCDASLLAAANAEADKVLMAEANKPAKVVTAPAPKPRKNKPTPKPVVKEKKPETIGKGKPKMGGSNPSNTVGKGKPKMGGSTNQDGSSNNTIGKGKPKMGGGK